LAALFPIDLFFITAKFPHDYSVSAVSLRIAIEQFTNFSKTNKVGFGISRASKKNLSVRIALEMPSRTI